MQQPNNIIRGVLCRIFAVMLIPAFLYQPSVAQQKIIVVTGAAGEKSYGETFERWADRWETSVTSISAADSPGDRGETKTDDSRIKDSRIEFVRIGNGGKDLSDRQQLKNAIEQTDKSVKELWVVLLGHGTDDRKVSKFNLRGRDVTASELNDWLMPLDCRIVLVNCASASGGFIAKLKGENRIIVTATKSPAQFNFARFGEYLSQTIADPTLDLDKDQQTSLLEAFIAASSQTQEFYTQETRLATELAMLDDNGDGKGTPADWFRGTRVVKKAKSGQPDGLAANQVFLVRRGVEDQLAEADRKSRDILEAKLESLRQRKGQLSEAAYYAAMEPIALELAEIYQRAENSDKPDSGEE